MKHHMKVVHQRRCQINLQISLCLYNISVNCVCIAPIILVCRIYHFMLKEKVIDSKCKIKKNLLFNQEFYYA